MKTFSQTEVCAEQLELTYQNSILYNKCVKFDRYECVNRTYVLYKIFFDIVFVKFDYTYRFPCVKLLRKLYVKMNFTHGKRCIKLNFARFMSKNEFCFYFKFQ